MGTQLTVNQKKDYNQVVETAIGRREDAIRAANQKPEMFKAALLNAIITLPQLATCNRESLYASIFKACEFGLMPDGRQAAIVPFKKQAQFIPMYQGLLSLARRHSKDISIRCENVHAVIEGNELVGDVWEDERGTTPRLIHRPSATISRNPKTIYASYATAHFPSNPVAEFEVMYREELMQFIKQTAGPWKTHPLEMFRIRPLKRLLKKLPLSGEFMSKMDSIDDDPVEEQSYEPPEDNEDIYEGEAVETEPEGEVETIVPKDIPQPTRKLEPEPKQAKPDPQPNQGKAKTANQTQATDLWN